MKKILVIDALGLFFKSYYGLEKTNLKRKDGFPVFAIYGFFKSLFKAIRELTPTHFVIVFDSKEKTFRKEMFEDYKANRKEAPEDLITQLEYLVELIERVKLPFLCQPGFEADDIIATIARDFNGQNGQVFILSSDKDLYQLVNDYTFIVSSPMSLSGSYKIIDHSGVIDKFGVDPLQIVDYLALVGDSSDNIPGVAGIGPKGAQELLAEYSGIKEIYEHIDSIKPSLQKKLEISKDNAFLSLKLATLEAVPHINENSYLVDIFAFSFDQLIKEFEKLEFGNVTEINVLKSFIKEKSRSKDVESLSLFEKDLSQPLKKADYFCIETQESLIKLIDQIKVNKWFVIDTETTSLNINDCEIIGVSIALEPYKAYYIPIFIQTDIFSKGISLKEFIDCFNPILEDENIKKIGHHLKYDYKVLKKYFKEINGLYFDTMIAAYLLEPDVKRYSMDYLAKKYLGYDTIAYDDLVGKNQTLKDVDLEKVVEYAAEDADITLRLYEFFKQKLEEKDLITPFFDVEMPLIKVLSQMETIGIGIDQNYFRSLEKELSSIIDEISKNIYELAGGIKFNLNSPKQMADVLFNHLKIAPKGGFKKRKQSTSEEVLLLMDHEPIIKKILEYRKYFKLYSTYVVPLMNYQSSKLEKKDQERVQTSFHQTGTATGRLASSDPNLQNIPIREEVGRKIRQGFIAKKGYVFLGLDYSQIELRLLAHFAKDEFLINAFKLEEDIHRMTASKIFNKSVEHINDEERSIAKTINFGIIYGMGAKKLSSEIGISMKEASEFIDKYFQVFSTTKEFIENTKLQVRKEEYVTTLLGHKRFFYNINQSESYLALMNERMAVNTIIQGSCADIMKKVMVKIENLLKDHTHTHLLLQIHDELIFEVQKEKVDEVSLLLKETMEQIFPLSVPLRVSLNVGDNWGELK